MPDKPWEPAWRKYKDAEDAYLQALEEFKRTPPRHAPSRRALIEANRVRNDALVAFFEAWDASAETNAGGRPD